MHQDHLLLATLVLIAIVLIAYCGCRHHWGCGKKYGRCPCGCPRDCACSASCRCRRSGACPP